MTSIENSPKQWNTLWGKSVFHVPGTRGVESLYRNAVYFSAFNKLLEPAELTAPNILEFGSGTGNNSLHLSQKYRAVEVSLVDFSGAGLAKVEKEKFLCQVETIQEDLLSWVPSRTYTLVHSTGLIEHFEGQKRLEVIQKHADAADKQGHVMIWVPVKSRAFEVIGRFNKFMGIQEIPFTEDELRELCGQSGLRVINEEHSAFGALFGVLAEKK